MHYNAFDRLGLRVLDFGANEEESLEAKVHTNYYLVLLSMEMSRC